MECHLINWYESRSSVFFYLSDEKYREEIC